MLDLQKDSQSWMLLIYLLPGLFFRTGYTLKDGLLSIRKGFTVDELRSHVQSAGLTTALRIGRSAIGNVFITGTRS